MTIWDARVASPRISRGTVLKVFKKSLNIINFNRILYILGAFMNYVWQNFWSPLRWQVHYLSLCRNSDDIWATPSLPLACQRSLWMSPYEMLKFDSNFLPDMYAYILLRTCAKDCKPEVSCNIWPSSVKQKKNRGKKSIYLFMKFFLRTTLITGVLYQWMKLIIFCRRGGEI